MIVWHYTTMVHFEKIMNDGFLRPTSVYVLPPEKPVLWFSANRYCEPTALKMVTKQGRLISLTLEGQLESFGVVRFGIDASKLIPWNKLKGKARIDPDTVRGLIRAAKDKGSKPSDWYGTLKPINIDDCLTVEFMDKNGAWKSLLTVNS